MGDFPKLRVLLEGCLTSEHTPLEEVKEWVSTGFQNTPS
jgi:hypothetical protein